MPENVSPPEVTDRDGELLATRHFSVGEVHRLAAILHRETQRLVRLVDDLTGAPVMVGNPPRQVVPRPLSPPEQCRRWRPAEPAIF